MSLEHITNTAAAHNGQLENAFLLFNELSEKLSESYHELQTQVATLSGELAEARSERLRQLTEKERLASRLEGLLDALPGAVIVLDANGTVTEMNPVARDMFGEHSLGKAWQHIASDALLTEGNELRLRDGRWLSLSVRELDAGEGSILLLTDVSETHELQQQLVRRQRLVSLGEMVASLAHQLRTPLSTALLTVSGLLQRCDDVPRVERLGKRLSERLRHLESMVSDMLVFARGDRSELERVRLQDLVRQLSAECLDQFAARDIELDIRSSIAGDCELLCHPGSLLGALQNLADNALDAMLARREQESGYQGCLKITISGDEHNGVRLVFTDNGLGMDAATMERVLEPFYTTRSDGTGLGLAVVEAIVDSLHGSIEITSNPGLGSEFCIQLPTASRHELLPGGFSNSHATRKNTEAREVKL